MVTPPLQALNCVHVLLNQEICNRVCKRPRRRSNLSFGKHMPIGDYERPLRINIFDIDDDGSTEDMGRVETSLRSILEAGAIPVSKQR